MSMFLRQTTDTEKIKTIHECYSSLFLNYLDNSKLHQFYGSQPVSMMQESVLHVTEKRDSDDEFLYNLTAKLDGTRMLLLLHPNMKGNVVFIDRAMTFYEPFHNYMYTSTHVCLFDGEMYEHVFFVFDMLYYNGYLCDYIFETRHCVIRELLSCNRDRFTDDVVSRFTNDTKIHLVSKLYMELKGFRDVVTEELYAFVTNYFSNNPVLLTLGLSIPLRYDGLIFTPRFTRYIITDNWKYPGNILYKWKPVRCETIDFVLNERSVKISISSKKKQKKIIGSVDGFNHNRVLFKTNNQLEQYAIIREDRSFRFKENTVYECGYDMKRGTFFVVRERPDKTAPNTLRTAKTVWSLISRPVDMECFLPLILKRVPIDTIRSIPTWQKALLRPDRESVVPINETLVSRFNAQNGNKGLFHEFEIHIGKINEQHFMSSVRFSHYKWLGQTLEFMNVPYIYNESIDVFDNNNTRTSYGTTICCIKKQR